MLRRQSLSLERRSFLTKDTTASSSNFNYYAILSEVLNDLRLTLYVSIKHYPSMRDVFRGISAVSSAHL